MLAPLTAARRIASRWLTRALDAGGSGRRMASARRVDNLNSEMAGAGGLVAARAAGLYHNDPHIRAGVDALVGHLVGTGFVPTSEHAPLKAAWRQLVRRADPAGRLDLDGIAKLAALSMIRDGECFILIHVVDDPTAPLRLEVIHRDQCPMDRFAETLPEAPGHRVRAGIEFDAANRPVAYHFLAHRPGDVTAPFDGNGWKTIRVPAENVLHIFQPLEAGQVRGLSWLAPVALTAHTLNAYRDAALEKAKVAALLAGFIRDPEGDAAGLPGSFANGVLTVGMEPGALIPVPTGSDITFSDPPQNTDFDPFVKSALRSIAVGMGCTYEQVSGDLSATTFSSARVGLLEFRRRMEPLQYAFAHQFHDPIWRRMVSLLSLSGAVDAPGFLDDPERYLSVEWLPPRWDYVNPLQDVNADIAAIEAGLKSRTQAVAERGYDITTMDRERAADATRAATMETTHA